MTSSSLRHCRDTAVVALAACVSMLAGAGCSALDSPADRPAAHRAATPETGSPRAHAVGHPTPIPTRTPARAPAARAPATAVAPVPSAASGPARRCPFELPWARHPPPSGILQPPETARGIFASRLTYLSDWR